MSFSPKSPETWPPPSSWCFCFWKVALSLTVQDNGILYFRQRDEGRIKKSGTKPTLHLCIKEGSWKMLHSISTYIPSAGKLCGHTWLQWRVRNEVFIPGSHMAHLEILFPEKWESGYWERVGRLYHKYLLRSKIAGWQGRQKFIYTRH